MGTGASFQSGNDYESNMIFGVVKEAIIKGRIFAPGDITLISIVKACQARRR